jgi:hypothetical protein
MSSRRVDSDKARTDSMIDKAGPDAIANLARQSTMGDEVLAETDVRKKIICLAKDPIKGGISAKENKVVPKISPALQNIKKAIVFFDQ